MGKNCAIYGCSLRRRGGGAEVDERYGAPIRWHRWPRNPVVSSRWIVATGRGDINKDNLGKKSVCSRHFTKEAYNNPKDPAGSTLLPCAVPTINVPGWVPKQSELAFVQDRGGTLTDSNRLALLKEQGMSPVGSTLTTDTRKEKVANSSGAGDAGSESEEMEDEEDGGELSEELRAAIEKADNEIVWGPDKELELNQLKLELIYTRNKMEDMEKNMSALSEVIKKYEAGLDSSIPIAQPSPLLASPPHAGEKRPAPASALGNGTSALGNGTATSAKKVKDGAAVDASSAEINLSQNGKESGNVSSVRDTTTASSQTAVSLEEFNSWEKSYKAEKAGEQLSVL